MNLEDLEREVARLEDIQAIEDLQKMYGYYMHSNQRKEIVDLFSDDAESLEVESAGLFLGKEGIKKFFLTDPQTTIKEGKTDVPGWINILILIAGGVVEIDPSGKTAKGRWTTWLPESMLLGALPRQQWVHGYYENEYVKEDGKWLFKKLHWNVTFFTAFEAGWLRIPLLGLLTRKDADAPAPNFHPYPCFFQLPYHFKHPVTGE
ncbi:MAG: nuclear transport factor 2 family protein [Syntrophorhabdales bacterium]|jgi:hypothetical protein